MIPSEVGNQKVQNNGHFLDNFYQYLRVIVFSAVLSGIFSYYIYIRRGYFDLYIANKVLAGVAAVLLGLTLLVGSLSRHFNRFGFLARYRKEFGFIAAFLAIAHALVSYFTLSDHFPVKVYYTSIFWPFIFGLLSAVIIVLLLVISNNATMKKFGGSVWWFLQQWGARLAFIFLALHVFVMKFSSWVSWYQTGGAANLKRPEWPGAGLLVGWFILFVVLIRFSELFGANASKIFWYISTIALPVIFVLTFFWGQQFVK